MHGSNYLPKFHRNSKSVQFSCERIKLDSWRPCAVIWCLRSCICLTSVVNVFRTGVVMATKRRNEWRCLCRLCPCPTNKKNAVKFLFYMTFVSTISKLTWNCIRDRICLTLRSEICELFARHQNLFGIAATPTGVDSNVLSYPGPLPLFQLRPKYNHLIHSWQWLPPANFIEIRSAFLRRKTGRTKPATDKAET